MNWKWGVAFFIGLSLLVFWAESTVMPTRIFLFLFACLAWIFVLIRLFFFINHWVNEKIEKHLKTILPLDKTVLAVSKFLMGIALFLCIQIMGLVLGYWVLTFYKFISK